MLDHLPNIVIRNANRDDVPFLYEMLFEAFHWNSIADRPTVAGFFGNPGFKRLLADWGRHGDSAVIAELDKNRIGAAWYRLWTDANHSYGYLDSQTPEIGMAVKTEFRSNGIGRLLLRSLMDIAQSQLVEKVSLSVDPQNFALELYTSEGFIKCGESGTSWTMVREFVN